MREIKFRAWDGEQFHYGTMGAFGLQWNGDDCSLPHGRVYVFDQFTGIQDCAGVDVYEGDIIRSPYNHIYDFARYQIVFSDGAFGERCVALHHIQTGFKDISRGGYAYSDHLTQRSMRKCTVIGNIYEHSHLLEES